MIRVDEQAEDLYWLVGTCTVEVHEYPVDDGGWVLELYLAERDFQRFIKRENLPADILERSGRDPSLLAATQR